VVVPEIENTHIAILNRRLSSEASGKMATDLAEYVRVRASDAPFKKSMFPDPNTHRASRSENDKQVERFEAGENEVFGPDYNPIEVDFVRITKCKFIRSKRSQTTPPANWDEKLLGSWWLEHKDEDGNVVKEPSGWYIAEASEMRPFHASKAEKMIDDPEKNILSFGNNRYVVGTGTHDKAAIFMVWQTRRGKTDTNGRAGDTARKRMGHSGNKDIRDLVFRIEDRPNCGGGVMVRSKWGKWNEVREMVYRPGQLLTLGNLVDGKGNIVDAKTIRAKASAGGSSGFKFKALSEVIPGKGTHADKLANEIAVTSDSSYEDSIRNLLTSVRVNPNGKSPYGLWGSQSDQAPYCVASGEGSVQEGHFSMGVALGSRTNNGFSVGRSAVKKAKKSDAASPVESDTADEEVAVEA